MHNNSFLFNCQPFLDGFSVQVFLACGDTRSVEVHVRDDFIKLLIFIRICRFIVGGRHGSTGRPPLKVPNSYESSFALDRREVLLHFCFFDHRRRFDGVSSGVSGRTGEPFRQCRGSFTFDLLRKETACPPGTALKRENADVALKNGRQCTVGAPETSTTPASA